jgi:hypothetical protein
MAHGPCLQIPTPAAPYSLAISLALLPNFPALSLDNVTPCFDKLGLSYPNKTCCLIFIHFYVRTFAAVELRSVA